MHVSDIREAIFFFLGFRDGSR